MQTYTTSPSNLYTADGSLHITAREEGTGYTSARITSTDAWFPGMRLPGGATAATIRIEARIQAAGPGQGLLSALWMLPTEPRYGAEWPASGEVRRHACRGTAEAMPCSSGLDVPGGWPTCVCCLFLPQIDIMGVLNTAETCTQGIHYGSACEERGMAHSPAAAACTRPALACKLSGADLSTHLLLLLACRAIKRPGPGRDERWRGCRDLCRLLSHVWDGVDPGQHHE